MNRVFTATKEYRVASCVYSIMCLATELPEEPWGNPWGYFAPRLPLLRRVGSEAAYTIVNENA